MVSLLIPFLGARKVTSLDTRQPLDHNDAAAGCIEAQKCAALEAQFLRSP
jgi:hypothetical protein